MMQGKGKGKVCVWVGGVVRTEFARADSEESARSLVGRR